MSKKAFQQGKRDKAKTIKQNVISSIFSPIYHPPKAKKEKDSYDIGYRARPDKPRKPR